MTDKSKGDTGGNRRGILGESATFLSAFLKKPGRIGAVLPSSKRLARAMVEGCSLDHADTVIELGPGTGVFTNVILESIGPDTTFLVIELEHTCAQVLRDKFPSLTVYEDSAANIKPILAKHSKSKTDCIISGLPWAGFPEKLQDSILDGISGTLKPAGIFTTFAYIHACKLPAARRFRAKLAERFSSIETSAIVWSNVPPAFVYRCIP